MNKMEKKLNLLLRCWLSDVGYLSNKAIEDETQLIKEVTAEVQKR